MPFDTLAPTLARFLSWLHAFPVHHALQLGVEHEDVASLIEEVRADALDDFERLNQVAPASPLEEWHTYLMEEPAICPPASATQVLVHRDLAAEHVLCDSTRKTVTGIIDWSDVAVSDGLVDFAGLFHWGGAPFVDAVLANYDGPVDRTLLTSARFLAACRGVADVAFGLDTGRGAYIEAGVRALSLCAGARTSR